MFKNNKGTIMLAPLLADGISQRVNLIGNSSIQFIDYEVILGKNDASVLDLAYMTTYFKPIGQSSTGERLFGRFIPYLVNPKDENAHYKLLNEKLDTEEIQDVASIDLNDALKLYNGVWFPVPCLDQTSKASRFGPIDWCRCRIVQVPLNEYEKHSLQEQGNKLKALSKYHITFAFDTKLASAHTERYIVPTYENIDAIYNLVTKDDLLNAFLTQEPSSTWVNTWTRDVLETLFEDRVADCCRSYLENFDFVEYDDDEPCKDQALKYNLDRVFYLSIISFLEQFVNFKEVQIICNSSNLIPVNLVLDIGNSRSCGLIYEYNVSAQSNNDDFNGVYKLELRDLNAPENVYAEPFASRIEFSKASFSFNNRQAVKNSDVSFNWPSIARVGTEASILAAHTSASIGRTGTSSPKRYLWNVTGSSGDAGVSNWFFNSYSYQVVDFDKKVDITDTNGCRRYLVPSALRSRELDKVEVTDSNIGLYLNSNGDATFALEDGDERGGFASTFCYKATMTFMLMEIILQALSQINSYSNRSQRKNKDIPRFLENIILTTPPSMPAQEKELLRLCAYEAVGILWKCLGYDKNEDPCSFNFRDADNNINPVVPKVIMDWNEAESCQIVYIYNETQKVFGGDCKAFIENLRSKSADHRILDKRYHISDVLSALKEDKEVLKTYTSARIATIDIGGGTTDLVIKDYSFEDRAKNTEGLILPSSLFEDGFKNAGDDIVKQIINDYVLDALSKYLDAKNVNSDAITNILFASTRATPQDVTLRCQSVQQILMNIAYRIMFHLEQYDVLSLDSHVKGTFEDFLSGNEKNQDLDSKPHIKRPMPSGMPESSILKYVNETIRKKSNLLDFDILKIELDIDLGALNERFVTGAMDISKALSPLCDIISHYNVDLLLISGRPSNIPGIRQFFLQRLALAKSRVIAMHQYRCDSWYPFNDSQSRTIDDPKTTAAVGALLCSLKKRDINFYTNFKFYVNPVRNTSQIRYFGIIDNNAVIEKRDVYFKYLPYTFKDEDEIETYQNYIDHMIIAKGDDFEQDRVIFDDVKLSSVWQPINTLIENKEDDIDEDLTKADIGSISLSGNVQFGYRQLNSPNILATPLYRLQHITNPQRSAPVRKAIALAQKENDLYETFGLVIKDPMTGMLSENKGFNKDIMPDRRLIQEAIFKKYVDEVCTLYDRQRDVRICLNTVSKSDEAYAALAYILQYQGSNSDLILLKDKYNVALEQAKHDCEAKADAKISQEHQGFASKLFGKAKREEDRSNLINEIFSNAKIELNMDVVSDLKEILAKYDDDKYFLMHDVYDDNVLETKNQVKETIDFAAQTLANQRDNIRVSLCAKPVLGYVKNSFMAKSYKKALREIKNKDYKDIRNAMFADDVTKYPVLICTLNDIRVEKFSGGEGKSIKDAFEIVLQTVNENDKVYWIDSGILKN